jgi:hypothetical protein
MDVYVHGFLSSPVVVSARLEMTSALSRSCGRAPNAASVFACRAIDIAH